MTDEEFDLEEELGDIQKNQALGNLGSAWD